MRFSGKALAAAVGAGLVLASMPVRADVEAGARKYEAGDYAGAIAEWLPEAAKNEPNALFNLGQVYRLGRGVPVDLEKSADYYERASNAGHISAQANLGTVLYFAEPPLRNRKKAIDSWRAAADAGEPRALYMMGVLFFNGDELQRDWPRAYAYTKAAAESGVPEARSALSEMERHVTMQDRTAAQTIAVRSMNSEPTVQPAFAQASAPMGSSTSLPGGNRLPPAPQPVRNSPLASSQPAPAPAPVQTAALPAANTPAPYTPAPAAAAAPAASPSTNSWRVQVGAFSSDDRAAAAWQAIQASNSAVVSGVSPVYQSAGGVTKLQLGSFASRSGADTLCSNLKAAGQGCFVVRPN